MRRRTIRGERESGVEPAGSRTAGTNASSKRNAELGRHSLHLGA
jgi:hypothetical protein